jgi:hypothetical protein
MQFLDEGLRPQVTVCNAKAKGTSDKRTVTVELSMLVDLSASHGMPNFLKDAWSSMRKSGSHAAVIELDGEIESQNVRFYRLLKDKETDMELSGVKLETLRLEKTGTQIFLYFKVQELLGKQLWDWLWYALLRTVYAEFEEGQMELSSATQAIKGAMDRLAEEGNAAQGKDDLTITLSSPGLGEVTTTEKGLKRATAKMKAAGK